MSTVLREGYVIRVKRLPNIPREDGDFILDSRVEGKEYVFINPAKYGYFSI